MRMVTGDNIETARAIAEKCGIVRRGNEFLELDSTEFNRRVTDNYGNIVQERMDETWPKLQVLASANPTDKYNLVNGIIYSQVSKHREVVAFVGVGTNDAPAINRADIGIAMVTNTLCFITHSRGPSLSLSTHTHTHTHTQTHTHTHTPYMYKYTAAYAGFEHGQHQEYMLLSACRYNTQTSLTAFLHSAN